MGKTKSERDQERYEAKRRAWEVFRPQLEGLRSFVDAVQLVMGMPRESAPGRIHYTNLDWFIRTLSPPGNSTDAEKGLYIQLVQYLELAPDAKDAIVQKLQKAMDGS